MWSQYKKPDASYMASPTEPNYHGPWAVDHYNSGMSYNMHNQNWFIGHRGKQYFVDSRERDISVYPNANHFVLRLPHRADNVTSMRLLHCWMPQRPDHEEQGGTPAPPEVWIKINAFPPLLETPYAASSFATQSAPPYTNPNVQHCSIADDAFFHMVLKVDPACVFPAWNPAPFQANFYFTEWREKTDYPVIATFGKPTSFDQLEVSVNYRDLFGQIVPYPFPDVPLARPERYPEEEWSMLIEAVDSYSN